MVHALILNASFEPIQIVPWQKAIQLLFQGKVEVVEESEQEVHSVRLTIRVPAVLRLLSYIPFKRKKNVIRFSRTNIFLRDKNQCQYCARKMNRSHLTLDHVIPVVQGGEKSWENIVTACKTCNQKKGGRTPQQAKMKLIRKPIYPHWLPVQTLSLSITQTPERWKIYFQFLSSSTQEETLLDLSGEQDESNSSE